MEQPIERLLERIRNGDAIAVHEFYERIEPFLRGMARRFLNPGLRRHMDSRDVAESVFRRALTGSMRAQFDNEKRFLAWLATIVRNRIRTLARRAHPPGDARFEPVRENALPIDGCDDPQRLASDAEEVQAFRVAMDLLLPDERAVIYLRDLEGLAHAEVAEVLKRPSADAARMLHQRAVKRLRDVLTTASEPPSA